MALLDGIEVSPSRRILLQTILIYFGLAACLFTSPISSGADPVTPEDRFWRSVVLTPVSQGIVVKEDNIYHLSNHNPPTVERVRIANFTILDELILPATSVESITADETHLFIGSLEEPAKIISVELKTFSIAHVLSLPEGEGGVAALHQVDNFLYAGTASDRLVKIDVSNPKDMKRVDVLNFATGGTLEGMDDDGDYLYVTTDKNSPTHFLRVRLNDFLPAGELMFGSEESSCQKTIVFEGFAYVVCNTQPGRIVKVRLEDFTRVRTVTFSEGVDHAQDFVRVGNNLYVFARSGPHKLVLVELEPFKELGYVTFPDGRCSGGIEALGVDQLETKLYAAFDVSRNESRLHEMILSEFKNPRFDRSGTRLAQPCGLDGENEFTEDSEYDGVEVNKNNRQIAQILDLQKKAKPYRSY